MVKVRRSVVRGLVVGATWNYGRSGVERRSPEPAVRSVLASAVYNPHGSLGIACWFSSAYVVNSVDDIGDTIRDSYSDVRTIR